MIGRVLKKLQQKLFLSRPQSGHQSPDLTLKHQEPIYRICCCLMEKTLVKELRRFQMNNKEMPQIILREIF